MPIFEYKCEKCNEKFTRLIWNIETDSEVKCPVCNDSKVRKIISTFSPGNANKSSDSSNVCQSGSFT